MPARTPQQEADMVPLKMVEDTSKQRAAGGDQETKETGARPCLEPGQDFEGERAGHAEQQELRKVTSP